MRVLRNQYRSRKRLLIDDQVAIYHIVTRTTCQQFLFGPEEREVFCNLLMKQADFSGVEVLSYCVMSNHVHLLLQINPEAKPSDPEILRRYENYYGAEKVPLSAYSASELKAILTEGGATADKERARVLARMNDLPAFMRELKQRFSIWYNHKHENTGTIWSARYKSLIVENSPETLTRVAAYIDLNPIRAGIVTDPKDYRWCSYSAGLAGQPRARKALIQLFHGKREYKQAIAAYRLILFGKGYQSKGVEHKDRGTISAERLEEVIQQNGHVPINELLRARIRYFSDGMALGSKAFIQQVFENNRDKFGINRKRAGARLPPACWGGLHVMRDLKKHVYS